MIRFRLPAREGTDRGLLALACGCTYLGDGVALAPTRRAQTQLEAACAGWMQAEVVDEAEREALFVACCALTGRIE